MITALIILTLASAGLWISGLTPTGTMLRMAVTLSGLQVYTARLLEIYPSLSFVSALGLWRAPIIARPIWRYSWVKAYVLMLLSQVLSLLWSPNMMLGCRYLIYEMPLLLCTAAAYCLATTEPVKCERLLKSALVLSLFEALATVLFRLSPSLEASYIASRLARVLISPNTLDALYGEGWNNIISPEKSGGLFFVNANVASVYLGVCGILAWAASKALNSRLVMVTSVCNLLAVPFAGSKVGMMFLAIVVTGFALTSTANRQARTIKRMVMLALAGVVTTLALMYMWNGTSLKYFLNDALHALDTRSDMWRFAWESLGRSPVLGIGFGEWESKLPAHGQIHGIHVTLAPHNSLLTIWAQSGAFAGCMAIAVVVSVTSMLRKTAKAVSSLSKPLLVGALLSWSWFWMQSMGENYAFNEVHLVPIFGLIFGYVMAKSDQHDERMQRALSSENDQSGTIETKTLKS